MGAVRTAGRGSEEEASKEGCEMVVADSDEQKHTATGGTNADCRAGGHVWVLRSLIIVWLVHKSVHCKLGFCRTSCTAASRSCTTYNNNLRHLTGTPSSNILACFVRFGIADIYLAYSS